jgi:hypothetical protein
MSTSSGRKFAQSLIDMRKQYGNMLTSPEQIKNVLDYALPPDKQYTTKGFKDLLGWLKGWKQ